jgi:hypothetical protein
MREPRREGTSKRIDISPETFTERAAGSPSFPTPGAAARLLCSVTEGPQVNSMNDQHAPADVGGPQSTYEAPPTPNSERSSSAYLVLGVNLVILAAAIWFVWQRYQASPSLAGGDAGSQAVAVNQDPAAKPAVGTRGGDLMSASAARPADPWASLSQKKGGPAPRPVYDDVTTAKMKRTSDEIEEMGVQLDVLRAVRGSYPTSAVAGNDRNRGVEALFQALHESGRDAGLTLAVGDTDGDGKTEILDGWGHPLVYFSPDDYATTQGWNAEGDASASKAPDGQWSAKMRFQLWSAGPNGKNDNGAGDDVCSWGIGKEQ